MPSASAASSEAAAARMRCSAVLQGTRLSSQAPGAVWSKGTDTAMTPEKLFSNANILRAHFMGEGFKPDSIAVNMPVAGGIVMFRGSDAKDRSVILLLQGTFENKENNQRVLTPTSLLLFYVADAKSPDIFKLPPGQF